MNTWFHAARRLSRRPGYTLSAIASLALGMGALGAIFTLTDALLLRPLPVRQPSTLVHIAMALPDGRLNRLPSPAADFITQQKNLFERVCRVVMWGGLVNINDHLRAANTHLLSGDCFVTLGTRPALGRLLSAADDRPGATRVVVLSYDAWMDDFQGSPDVLGNRIDIDGTSFTIVGVTERGFKGLQLGFTARFFYALSDPLILGGPRTPPSRSTIDVDIIARLQPGVELDAAAAQLQARWGDVVHTVMPPHYHGAQADTYRASRLSVATAANGLDGLLRPQFRNPLMALLALAAIVLVAVCANLGSLSLMWAAERRNETLVCAALGAPRLALVMDYAAEGALLLAISGVAGAFLAYGISAVLVAIFASAVFNLTIDLAPDGRILAFITAVSAIVFVACVVILMQTYPCLLVRVDRSTGNITGSIQDVVRRAGREHVTTFRSLTDVRDASLSKERLLAWLATPFGVLGLAIVGIGLYSLLHFAVTQRTREIGLRMALGGTRRDIAWLICRDASATVLIGLVCGVPAAIAVTRSAALLLYGHQSLGALPITTAVGLIVIISGMAVWMPARRAAAIEPMQALRYD